MSDGIGSIGGGLSIPPAATNEVAANKINSEEKAKGESTQLAIDTGETAAPRAEFLTGQSLNVSA